MRTDQILLAGGMAYAPVQSPDGRRGWTLRRDLMPDDTWLFNGTEWRQQQVPALRRMAPLTGGPNTGSVLRVAGESESEFHGDLWRWSGTAWNLIPGAAIPPRHGPAVALDTRRQQLVMFGGTLTGGQASAALWEFDRRGWREISQ